MSSVAVAEHAHASSDDFTGQPLGKIGVVWFLASEVMVFGGLIGAYILSRIAAGGWAAERAHVNTKIAVINTLVLLTSSFTIVEAHAAAVHDQQARARRFMLFTVLLGCAFLGFKTLEYSIEIEHGILPSTGLFWSFYYTMTGLHGFHVLIGIIVNLMLYIGLAGAGWGKLKHRIEYAGLYWHFVDVVWIFLFPLLYLA
jgi:heme/copper-type cytochrome/quinol oxidase subunit 3